MSCKFKLFKDLWRSRCCLKDIEGFDHSVVNSTLGACGELPPDQDGPCLTYSIWQCGENNVNNLSFLYEEETQPCFVVLGFFFFSHISCFMPHIPETQQCCLYHGVQLLNINESLLGHSSGIDIYYHLKPDLLLQ